MGDIAELTPALIGPFLAVLFGIHSATVYYVYLRKDLASVSEQNHGRTVSLLASFVPMADIVVEFFQLTRFVFDKDLLAPRTAVAAVFSTNEVAVETYTVFAFGVTAVYALLIGTFIAKELPVGHWLGPIIFDLLAGTAFITVASGLLMSLDCGDTATDGSVLVANHPDVVCFQHHHIGVATFALISILFYSSTDIFVACYRGGQDDQGVRVRSLPMFLAIERTSKGVFVVSTILGRSSAAGVVIAASVTATLLILIVILKPSSLVAANRVRKATLTTVLWTYAIYALFLVTDADPESDLGRALRGAWWAGVAFCLVALVLWRAYFFKDMRKITATSARSVVRLRSFEGEHGDEEPV